MNNNSQPKQNSGTHNTIVFGASYNEKKEIIQELLSTNIPHSFIIDDSTGMMYNEFNKMLEEKGYIVKRFNLYGNEKSHTYNPLAYIKRHADVYKVADIILNETECPEHAEIGTLDAEHCLLTTVISYLVTWRPRAEQTFSMLCYLLKSGIIEDLGETPMELLFKKASEQYPESFFAKQYLLYSKFYLEVKKEAIDSLLLRLKAFTIEDTCNKTNVDLLSHRENLSLTGLGSQPTVIFVTIPATKYHNALWNLLFFQASQCINDKCLNTIFVINDFTRMGEWFRESLLHSFTNNFSYIINCCYPNDTDIDILHKMNSFIYYRGDDASDKWFSNLSNIPLRKVRKNIPKTFEL